uniref:Putative ovule protein n=1 Tax=Solanum chacoense TaxID=4108 RepID=A0A0V0GSY9_SOLCH
MISLLFPLRVAFFENSNFEFLEPKLAIKGNHLILIKGIRNHPKIIQKSIELKHTSIFFRVQNFFIFWSFCFDLKLESGEE